MEILFGGKRDKLILLSHSPFLILQHVNVKILLPKQEGAIFMP